MQATKFTQQLASHIGNVRTLALALFIILMSSAPASIAETWRVQVMAVQDLALAEQLEEQIQRAGHEHVGIHWRDGKYKVWVGAEETETGAQELQEQLVQQGFDDAFIIEAGPDDSLSDDDLPIIADQPYAVQVFSLSKREDAGLAAEKARKQTGYDAVIVSGNGLFRVQLGPFESRDAADFAKQVILDRGYAGAFLVPFDN
jgi:hypothetical protein